MSFANLLCVRVRVSVRVRVRDEGHICTSLGIASWCHKGALCYVNYK